MKSLPRWLMPLPIFSLLLAFGALGAAAQQQRAGQAELIKLAGGKLTLQAPKEWKATEPRSRIIEHEFVVPGENEGANARLTIMGAGGGVERNIERWINQFPEKSAEPKVTEKKIAEQEVHLVDISGTFNDQPAPFAEGVLRENYRLLGAIIVTENLGTYFLKLTGPATTAAAQEKAFKEMVESLRIR